MTCFEVLLSWLPANTVRAAATTLILRSKATPEALADLYFGPTSSSEDAPAPCLGNGANPLCAQAGDALSLALAGADNGWLRDLIVVRVTPRRGSACLEVVLEAPSDHDLSVTTQHAKRAVGWLRRELADAIARKRVPELVVVVVPQVPPEETR